MAVTIRMIDLFAGIGGIRLGMEQAFGSVRDGDGETVGSETVFVSEKNKYSRETYSANFDVSGLVGGIDEDVRNVDADLIPDFDLLLGGFPCQPFSLAGVSKKNSMGRPTGFADRTSGTLFFDVARIIDAKRPAAFLLENVKNLLSHDHGNTFRTIMSTLVDELGYHIAYKVVDASGWVPQHRERIYIVGFREDVPFGLNRLIRTGHGPIGSILEPDGEATEKATLHDGTWKWLQAYRDKHIAAGHGFGCSVMSPEDDHTRTLSARYHKDGSEILIGQGDGANPRKLTPRECARLMGFPDDYVIPVSDTQAYTQFGNSVVVPVIRAIGVSMAPYLLHQLDPVHNPEPRPMTLGPDDPAGSVIGSEDSVTAGLDSSDPTMLPIRPAVIR